MSFEEFQDGGQGGHLGYRNGTILAIMNLCVTVMPPIKFQLNRTLGDVVWRISRWQSWWWPSWISERNDFSNSESPCCHNASYWVSAQSNLWFWRRCRKCEKLTMDDGRTTDNRPLHKLTCSKATDKLKIHKLQPQIFFFFFWGGGGGGGGGCSLMAQLLLTLLRSCWASQFSFSSFPRQV